MTDPRTEVEDARRIAALWTGLLLAPTVFLANLQVGYALVPAACRQQSTLPIHLVHAASLLLALGGALVAHGSLRITPRAPSGDDTGRAGRTRFMARLGVAVSLSFALVILSQWIPSLALSPCQ